MSWLINRVSEPSTWAGFAVLGQYISTSIENSAGNTTVLVGSLLAGLSSILISEKKMH